MLALTTELARYPRGDGFAYGAQGRSAVCGSSMTLGLDLDKDGRVSGVGLSVSACAVGQSSAAIMAGAIKGVEPETIRATFIEIEAWLAGEGEAPAWPRFEELEAALPLPGRHGAVILPWQTAVKALSSVL